MPTSKETVQAHWDEYVGPLTERFLSPLTSDGVLITISYIDLYRLLEFTYVSSGLHFWKHALEEVEKK